VAEEVAWLGQAVEQVAAHLGVDKDSSFGVGHKLPDSFNDAVNAEIANPPSNIAISHTFGIKITINDDMTEKCQEFVNRLG
jgi:hypothetical protein